MKYSKTNKPLVCMMTNSTCYKGTRTMEVKGILWHSTGANNPNLRRYVQPSSGDTNYNKLIELLGKNTNGTDWNHTSVQAGLNCWIGKLADGTVTTVQTMPWNYRPWGCGSGSKGSCNNGWIQFEICEDSLNDKDYFNKAYKEACEITAYLCDMYGIDPKGTVTMNGVKVPTILCHADSCRLGLGSNHADVMHWFPKYGKDMDDVRNDVAALMKGSATSGGSVSTTAKPEPSSVLYRVQTGAYSKKENANAQLAKVKAAGFEAYMVKVDNLYKIQVGAYSKKSNADAMAEKLEAKGFDAFITTTGGQAASVADAIVVGDKVKMQNGAPVYNMNYGFNDWVYDSVLYVREIKGNCIVVSTQKTGAITGSVDKKYLTKI